MSDTSIPAKVADLRRTFQSGRTRPYTWRAEQLRSLKALMVEREEAIFAALKADFAKPGLETFISESGVEIRELDHVLEHLKAWMRPQKVATPIVSQPGRSKVVYEPLGVVLIMAPWNYPFGLAVSPLIGALAAGNCALLKPSEKAPETSALLAEAVGKYLDPDAVKVVEGGAEVAETLFGERFDHIFFTGSARVGKTVMAAAAEHLTPVTLELGGKSPCIVDRDADLAVAARRIAWGKFMNAGQTCVAPDYVLAHETVERGLVEQLALTLRAFYGEDPRASPDYARIIDDAQFDRLAGLIGCGEIALGGTSDRAERYIAPTVLTKVAPDSPVMAEEIFGPILPVLTVSGIEEAIAFVNDRPKPLALYLFSNNTKARDGVVERTSSGGVCINDTVVHFGVPDLPFGGVGQSGMGAYHGRASFATFSHAKGVLAKWQWPDVALRYPPYTDSKLKWLKRLT